MIAKETLEDLYNNDKLTIAQIAIVLNTWQATIRKLLIKYEITLRGSSYANRKYTVNHDFFEIIDTEIKAYWLGFMYADGHLSQRKDCSTQITLTQVNKLILEQFKLDIEATYPIGTYTSYSGFIHKNGELCKYSKITIASNKMATDLIDKGCVQNKSLILKFPTSEQVPDHLIHHFIRGYFDGDGSVFQQKGTRHYKNYSSISHYLGVNICGTKEFLIGMHEKLMFLPKDAHVIHKEERKSTNCYNLRLTSTKRCILFKEFIYKDSTRYMARKKETFRDYNENYHKRVDRIVRSE